MVFTVLYNYHRHHVIFHKITREKYIGEKFFLTLIMKIMSFHCDVMVVAEASAQYGSCAIISLPLSGDNVNVELYSMFLLG